MKHEGSRQVGGYRSSSDPPAKATSLRKHPRPAKRQPERDPNTEFHRVLAQLRNALWNDDHERITQLERRIDHIVSEWEPHP